jgi:hypothetical protein
MRKVLSIVLAMALCTGWSTAQAAPKIPFHHQYSIEDLAKAIALANKEINTPPPKTIWIKTKEKVADAAGFVTSVYVLVRVPVDICRWSHLYEWCAEDSNDNHHPYDHE